MNDSELMNILNSTDDLFKNFASLFLSHSFSINNVVKKFSFLHKFHHKEKMLGRFYNFVKLNDVGMPYKLEDMDLS